MASLVRLHLAFDRYSDVSASQTSVRRFPTKIWTAFDGPCLSVTLTLLFRFENLHPVLRLESDGRFAMWLKGCFAIGLLSAFLGHLPFLERSSGDLAVGDIKSWYVAWCIVNLYVMCLYTRISSTESTYFSFFTLEESFSLLD